MKCQFCGTENQAGTQYCCGCGSKIGNTPISNNGQYYVPQPNVGYNNYPPKKNTGLIVTIVLLICVIVGLTAFGLWYFVIRDGDSSTKEEIVEKKDDDKPVDKPVDEPNDSNETFELSGYTFTVPKGWTTGIYEEKRYIQDSERVIMVMSYPLDYNTLIEYKDSFIDGLVNQGFNIDTFTTRKMDGIDFILVTGSISNTGFGYMFADIDSDFTIFLTITPNSGDNFNESWFNYGSSLVKTAKK